MCILHLTMAMGRLLGEFVGREARSLTPALRQDLQVLLSERRAGWSVYGSASPDREETANFFDAWPDIARCLGIRPGTAKYKAIANMWDLLQALYCTYQGPNPLNCDAAPLYCRNSIMTPKPPPKAPKKKPRHFESSDEEPPPPSPA